MDINVNSRELDNMVQLIEAKGEIDVYTSSKLKDAINAHIDQGKVNLIIDLEGVRYIDSTGLGVLIGALKRVREGQGHIALVCTNGQVVKIFDITGLSKIFEICPTVQKAEAFIAQGK